MIQRSFFAFIAFLLWTTLAFVSISSDIQHFQASYPTIGRKAQYDSVHDPSMMELIRQDGKHNTYMVSWTKIKPHIKGKWSWNREPVPERVEEIADTMNKGGYVPHFLHLADLQDEGLVCYDGNHRREAYSTLDLPPSFTIFIDVILNATREEVVSCCENLNKAIPLASVHLADDRTHKEGIIQIVRDFEAKYKAFVKPSRRPLAPNFNRDNFEETLHLLYEEYKSTWTISELHETLIVLNKRYSLGDFGSRSIRDSISQKIRHKGGLWLFCKKELNAEHVRHVFDDKKKSLLMRLLGKAKSGKNYL